MAILGTNARDEWLQRVGEYADNGGAVPWQRFQRWLPKESADQAWLAKAREFHETKPWFAASLKPRRGEKKRGEIENPGYEIAMLLCAQRRKWEAHGWRLFEEKHGKTNQMANWDARAAHAKPYAAHFGVRLVGGISDHMDSLYNPKWKVPE